MIKKLKDGGMVVIDKSHKALYSTPVSCMEYFNAIALTGFALVFFTNYAFIMGLPSYKKFYLYVTCCNVVDISWVRN